MYMPELQRLCLGFSFAFPVSSPQDHWLQTSCTLSLLLYDGPFYNLARELTPGSWLVVFRDCVAFRVSVGHHPFVAFFPWLQFLFLKFSEERAFSGLGLRLSFFFCL